MVESVPLTSPDFILPDGTERIEAKAFWGIAAKWVQLPESTVSIGSQAFAYCPNLQRIYTPESCTSIAYNAFDQVTGLTIYGISGSYAETFANRYHFDFVSVN
ncbi:MAG: leucine-rich repeat protein [Clostridia bacterium]|nr:leucine-rich repeat protein [Clostridia bacterium]